jgi:hypothetical protein
MIYNPSINHPFAVHSYFRDYLTENDFIQFLAKRMVPLYPAETMENTAKQHQGLIKVFH